MVLTQNKIMSLATEVASGRIHDWQPKPPARKSLLGVQTNHCYDNCFISINLTLMSELTDET
jgi:hypothetical protein